jgi:hypothetical protein
MTMRTALAVVVVAACYGSSTPEPPAPPPPRPRPMPHPFDADIAALASIDASGIGFSPTMTGTQFLPDPNSDEHGMLVLGQPPPERSAVLTRLVAGGADAVPALLRCLDNATPTKLPPVEAMMWQAQNDEYDVNRRTTAPPAGVNRDDQAQNPAPYVVTVGDLCFVALGQIVNRSFAAVRYQPTGGLIVNSPSASPALRHAVRAEWGSLTRASLRASLVRDFREPDWEGRRVGAMIRLAYYERDALKPLLDAELARPTYDVSDVDAFARSLYPAATADRARVFRAYVAAHGAAARDGIEQVLFADLDTQEAFEQKRISPATTGSDYRARECLVELYGRATSVTHRDRPYPAYSSTAERERLVKAMPRGP